MKSEILEFYSKAVKDEKLAKRLQELLRNNVGSDAKEIISEVLLPYSKKLGYNFSEDDFWETLTKELSPEDLEQVSGGFGGLGSWIVAPILSFLGPGAANVPPQPPQQVVIAQQQAQNEQEQDVIIQPQAQNEQEQDIIIQPQAQNGQAVGQGHNEADNPIVNNQDNVQFPAVIEQPQAQNEQEQDIIIQPQAQNGQAAGQGNFDENMNRKLAALERDTIFIDCSDDIFQASCIAKDCNTSSVPCKKYVNALQFVPKDGLYNIPAKTKDYTKTEIRDLCDSLFNELAQNGQGEQLTLYNAETDLYETVNIKYMDIFIYYLEQVIANQMNSLSEFSFENVEILLPNYFDADKIATIKNNLHIINKFFPGIKSIDVQNAEKFAAEDIVIGKKINSESATVATLDVGLNHSTLNIFKLGDKETEEDKITKENKNTKYKGATPLAKYEIDFGYKRIRDKLKDLILEQLKEELKEDYEKDEGDIKKILEKNEIVIEKFMDKYIGLLNSKVDSSIDSEITLEDDIEDDIEIKIRIELEYDDIEKECQEHIDDFKKKIKEKLHEFNENIDYMGYHGKTAETAIYFIGDGLVKEIMNDEKIKGDIGFLHSESNINGARNVFDTFFNKRKCDADISEEAIRRLKLEPIDITDAAQNSSGDFKMFEMFDNNKKISKKYDTLKSAIINYCKQLAQKFKGVQISNLTTNINKFATQAKNNKVPNYIELISKVNKILNNIYTDCQDSNAAQAELQKLYNDLNHLLNLNKKVSTARTNQQKSPNDQTKINELKNALQKFNNEAAKLESFKEIYKEGETDFKINNKIIINPIELITENDAKAKTNNKTKIKQNEIIKKAGANSKINNKIIIEQNETIIEDKENNKKPDNEEIKINEPNKQVSEHNQDKMSTASSIEEKAISLKLGGIDVSYLFDLGDKITVENLMRYDTEKLSSIYTSLNNIKKMHHQFQLALRKLNNDKGELVRIATSKVLKNKSVNKEKFLSMLLKAINEGKNVFDAIATLQAVNELNKFDINVSYLFNYGEKITLENLLKYNEAKLTKIYISLKNIKTMYMKFCESRREISKQISSDLKKPEGNKEAYLRNLLKTYKK